jgi:hypothetical protein
MTAYRTKPVLIEAVEWDGNHSTMAAFLQTDWGIANDKEDLVIFSLDGNMFASIDDFVIRGVQGEFYTCKAGLFDLIYEEASLDDANSYYDRTYNLCTELTRELDTYKENNL